MRDAAARRDSLVHGGWTRKDLWSALLLGVVAALVRVPWRSRHLATWDSVLFALGMERYDVLDSRPHPPGYPLYVALGKTLQLVFADANDALVALSLVFTAAAVAGLYVLVRHWAPAPPAIAAATLLALSPVMLFNSLIATTYCGEAFASVLLGVLAWRHLQRPSLRSAIVLAATFALAVGVRQSLVPFLGPIVGAALLGAPLAWPERIRRGILAVAAAALVGLTWFIPMVLLSGGLGPYLAATRLQTTLVLFASTVFNDGAVAWADLWPRFQIYVAAEREWLLPVVLLGVAVPLVRGWRPRMSWRGALFLAAWVLPPLLFYLLIFNGWDRGPDGYILVLLPAFYALAALAVWRGLDAVASPRGRAVLGCALLLVPCYGFASSWGETHEARVVEHDRWVDAWLGLNSDPAFAPETTGIVASFSWAHVKWHHPDHRLWSMMRIHDTRDVRGDWFLMIETRQHEDDRSFYEAHLEGADGSRHPVPAGLRRIVLFDFQLAGENGAPPLLCPDVPVREGQLADGWRVLYVDVEPSRPFVEDYFQVPVNQEPGSPAPACAAGDGSTAG